MQFCDSVYLYETCDGRIALGVGDNWALLDRADASSLEEKIGRVLSSWRFVVTEEGQKILREL